MKPMHSTYYYSHPNQSQAYYSSLSATGATGVHYLSPASGHTAKNGSSSFLPRIAGASAFSNYSANSGYTPVTNVKVSKSENDGDLDLFCSRATIPISIWLVIILSSPIVRTRNDVRADIHVCIKHCTLKFFMAFAFFYCSHVTSLLTSFSLQPFRSKTRKTSKNKYAWIYCKKRVASMVSLWDCWWVRRTESSTNQVEETMLWGSCCWNALLVRDASDVQVSAAVQEHDEATNGIRSNRCRSNIPSALWYKWSGMNRYAEKSSSASPEDNW